MQSFLGLRCTPIFSRVQDKFLHSRQMAYCFGKLLAVDSCNPPLPLILHCNTDIVSSFLCTYIQGCSLSQECITGSQVLCIHFFLAKYLAKGAGTEAK